MAENAGLARPYAEAVFELARDDECLGGWSDTLHAAAESVRNDDLIRLIQTPGADMSALVALIVGICRDATPDGGPDLTQVSNLLRVLAENGRLPVLPEIADRFDKLKADVENSVDVVLTAAVPVDAKQQQKIAAALKQRLGRDVNLHFQLDENLIGGARIQADDLIIDGSVRTGLEKLSSALAN